MDLQHPVLTVRINNTRPVELFEFCDALRGIGEEYKSFLANGPSPHLADEISLHVTEVRKGSLIADLAPYMPFALALANDINATYDFCTNLQSTFDWLKKGILKDDASREAVENVASIIKPVAKDSASSMVIEGGVKQGSQSVFIQNLTLNITSNEAKDIFEGCQQELAHLGKRKGGLHEKAVLTWYQARNDPHSKAGDRAIIESLYAKPVKAIFTNESVKAKILADKRSLFKQAYLVDVWAETIQGRPVLYRIAEMHGTIPLR